MVLRDGFHRHLSPEGLAGEVEAGTRVGAVAWSLRLPDSTGEAACASPGKPCSSPPSREQQSSCPAGAGPAGLRAGPAQG